MNLGPWLFRNQAVIIDEYDGIQNPRSVVLHKIAVWAHVIKLLDNFLDEEIVKKMRRNMGVIQEVQIRLSAGHVGSFVRFRIKVGHHVGELVHLDLSPSMPRRSQRRLHDNKHLV